MRENINYKNIKHGQIIIDRSQLDHAQAIIEAVPSPLFIKDVDMQYLSCNKAFLELLEVTEDRVIGRKNLNINSSDLNRNDEDLIVHGGTIEFETMIKGALGEEHYCVITKSQLRDLNDQLLGIVGIIRDITEEKKQRNHVHRLMLLKDAMVEITHAIMDNWSEQVLYDLILKKAVEVIENSDHGSVLMGDENDMFSPVAWIGYTNEAMKSFSVHLHDTFNWLATDGHGEKSVMINDISPYMTGDIPDIAETEDEATIKASLCSPIMVNGKVVGFMNMDSSKVDAFTDLDMELVNYMSEQIEIALTKRTLYDKVLYLSQHDELTGLLNRRYFEDLAHKTVTYAKQHNKEFCLVVFDINDLKHINDTYGHQTGDTFIKQFAKALKGIFRETDHLGRYGGDEFIGIFCSMDWDMIMSRINDVLKTLKNNPMSIGGEMVYISFSFGIASYPSDGATYEKLVSIADKSMYDHKNVCKGYCQSNKRCES